MVENPLEMQKTLTIPPDHMKVCEDGSVPTAGNAAGNTKDYSDLSGNNVSPAPLPAGFTAKGIVALVFSIIAAFLGLAVIGWYGAAPLGASTQAAAEREIADADMLDGETVTLGSGVKTH